MKSPQPSTESKKDIEKPLASTRLIATIGSARILSHRDGRLDVHSCDLKDREAALSWLFSVMPHAVSRVRTCE